jgi:hypothetical protein
MHGRGVYVHCKPLLWYVKGERRREGCSKSFPDFVQSERPEKVLHGKSWEQSPVEAEYMLDACSVENQIVLDPMMGSGTTGIAALKLNRNFIGIEINKNEFVTAKANISKFVFEMKEDYNNDGNSSDPEATR